MKKIFFPVAATDRSGNDIFYFQKTGEAKHIVTENAGKKLHAFYLPKNKTADLWSVAKFQDSLRIKAIDLSCAFIDSLPSVIKIDFFPVDSTAKNDIESFEKRGFPLVSFPAKREKGTGNGKIEIISVFDNGKPGFLLPKGTYGILIERDSSNLYDKSSGAFIVGFEIGAEKTAK